MHFGMDAFRIFASRALAQHACGSCRYTGARHSRKLQTLSRHSRGNVHILSACNEYRQETVILERSALASGYTFRAVGVGGPWQKLGTKLVLYDRALQELVGNEIHPEDPVMLLDAWDTVILGGADELREKLEMYGVVGSADLVIGAGDRICAPDYKLAPRMESLYPYITTPWRYPNSGAFIGTAAAMKSFLHRLVWTDDGAQFLPFSADDDDQLRVQMFLLLCAQHGNSYPFEIDEHCRFFQCLGEQRCVWDYEPERVQSASSLSGSPEPRIRNQVTGERPVVVHGCGGNGRWYLAEIYRKLHLLEHLQISDDALQEFPYAGLVPPGEEIRDEHWVNLAPWDFTFFLFEAMRLQAIREEQSS